MKFAGQRTHVVKTTQEMREQWPIQTIDFLQNKIEWAYQTAQPNPTSPTIHERERGTPQRILCK